MLMLRMMPPLLCRQIDAEVDAKLRGQSVLDSQPVIPAIYCADVPEQTGLVQWHHLLAHGDTAAGKAVTPEVYMGGQRGLVALSGTGYYRHDRAGGVAQIIADDDNRRVPRWTWPGTVGRAATKAPYGARRDGEGSAFAFS